MEFPKPTTAQKAWKELGYGLFIHFGPVTISGITWNNRAFRPVPKKVEVQQWAEVACEAGMKYAVLTAKHVDGFCLWPSKYTDYSVKNAPRRLDIVGAFTEEFRKAGLKVGLYYALWDQNYPQYEQDEIYAEYMRNQIQELLTNYGEILELWFDGAWDKDYPTRDWPYHPEWELDPKSGLGHGERWQWKKIYETVHRLQPNCLVVNNSSSDRPGDVRYHPVDIRTSEHFDFLWKEKICDPILDPIFENEKGEKVYIPLEYCTTLSPGWFWIEGQTIRHPSVATICGWYRTARKHQANLLLNAGPNKEGVIPEYNRSYLKQAAKELWR
ncbi:MAG: alpha-L-fucosidase [bacterium]|nr:alpha-L-fucosidase [bacterium]